MKKMSTSSSDAGGFVKVRLFGALAWVARAGEVEVPVDGSASVGDVIRRLAELKPELSRLLIDAELNDPRVNTLILVNGRDIEVLNGLETRVGKGDEVVLASLIRGLVAP